MFHVPYRSGGLGEAQNKENRFSFVRNASGQAINLAYPSLLSTLPCLVSIHTNFPTKMSQDSTWCVMQAETYMNKAVFPMLGESTNTHWALLLLAFVNIIPLHRHDLM